MKAIYQKPACEIVNIQTGNLLGVSQVEGSGDNEVGSGNQLSREYDDWDD